MTSKDTNPKDALGVKKAPLSTVPCKVLFEIGLAMLEGARKYGRHNYRIAGVRASVYYDAALRHLMSFWEGEDIDPDSGSSLPHIIKAIACLTVLRDSQHMSNWINDRPPRLPGGLDLSTLNRQAAEIIERYPDAKKPFTRVNELSGEYDVGIDMPITDPARLLPAEAESLKAKPRTCRECGQFCSEGASDPGREACSCFHPKDGAK